MTDDFRTQYQYLFGPTDVANYTYAHTKYERLYEENYEITYVAAIAQLCLY